MTLKFNIGNLQNGFAKLRDFNNSENPILLHTNMDAGHGGASGRFKILKEVALEYAFLIGIEKKFTLKKFANITK